MTKKRIKDHQKETGRHKIIVKKRSSKYGAYVLSFIIFLVLQELIFRLCFPLPEIKNFNRINYQILDEIGEGGPGYLRNINMTWGSSLDTTAKFVHSFNTYGFRDKEWKEKKGGKKRIIFLGDSFVEGMMSTQENRITESFLREAKKAGEDYDLFNAGMMGIGLNEYIKFLVDAVPVFRPDEVFLVLYSNDIPFQRPYEPPVVFSPDYFNPFRPRLLEVLDHFKSKSPIPFVLKKETRPFYQPVPDPSNPWTSRSNELAPNVTSRIANEMKSGNFNFFRMNWILEEEKFLRSSPDVSDKLRYIRDYLNSYDCQLTVFYIPTRSQVTDYYYEFEKQTCLIDCPDFLSLTYEPYHLHRRILKQELNNLQVPFYDLTPTVQKEEDKGNHLYWDYDDHMRGKGYNLLGKSMYELWKK